MKVALIDDLLPEAAKDAQLVLDASAFPFAPLKVLAEEGALTAVGLDLTQGPEWTFDEYEQLGNYLGIMNRSCMWWKRFASKIKIDASTGCWMWIAALDKDGYAKFHSDGRVRRTGRVSYETFIGPLAAGQQVDHLCRVRACVNPWHLEAVTGAENRRRGDGFPGIQSRQTHCISGHPFDEANTYRSQGHRYCRACRKTTNAAWYRQSRAA